MSELALKLIAENKDKYARGEDARVLDLGNCGLMEVPEEVGELVWLEELKISLNELDFLKEIMYNSESYGENIFKAFLLSKKIVVKIPNLPKLKKLIIKKNSAIIDLGFISNLNGLNTLICKSVVLFSLNGIEKLTNLKNLDISNTIVQDFSVLGYLTNLRVLNCSRTYLEEVSFIAKLPFLQNLYLGSTWIRGIEQLQYLKDLRRLELQYSSDVSDLTPLADLDQIREINLAYTAVVDLSPLQKLLKKEKKISRKYSKNTINIRGCKIVIPPPEIIKKGNEVILNYFAERSKQQFKNTEIKLILIGNSTAGKTSLSRYLRERIYQSGQPTTHGIHNYRWQPEGRDMQVNCWDFGGQEYYHATHRLFLSRNAVYTLVWDAQTDQGGVEPTDIYYENDPKPYAVQLEHFPQAWWLKNIRHYIRESNPPVPILMVQNKCARDDIQRVSGVFEKSPYNMHPVWLDNHIDIEAAAVHLANPQPHTKKWQRSFEEFEERLLDKLESQLTHYEFAVYHRDIRDKVRELAAADTTDLPYADFEQICRDIEPDAKMDLVEIYLRDITGDILYYSHNERLRERVFLRPDWVCNSIYQIGSRISCPKATSPVSWRIGAVRRNSGFSGKMVCCSKRRAAQH